MNLRLKECNRNLVTFYYKNQQASKIAIREWKHSEILNKFQKEDSGGFSFPVVQLQFNCLSILQSDDRQEDHQDHKRPHLAEYRTGTNAPAEHGLILEYWRRHVKEALSKG